MMQLTNISNPDTNQSRLLHNLPLNQVANSAVIHPFPNLLFPKSDFVPSQTDPSTEVDDATASQEASKAARGERTAENIRYGQAISEQGMGGQTTTSSGQANVEGGYGGTEEQVGKSRGGEGEAGSRTEQGYGEGNDMSQEVGA